MHRPLFLRILRVVQREDDYFTIRCDATGLAGLGPLQKVCADLRILAYIIPLQIVGIICFIHIDQYSNSFRGRSSVFVILEMRSLKTSWQNIEHLDIRNIKPTPILSLQPVSPYIILLL